MTLDGVLDDSVQSGREPICFVIKITFDILGHRSSTFETNVTNATSRGLPPLTF